MHRRGWLSLGGLSGFMEIADGAQVAVGRPALGFYAAKEKKRILPCGCGGHDLVPDHPDGLAGC